LPGQQLTYLIKVVNNDVGCSASSFALSLSGPAGFSVSLPTSTVNLKSPAVISVLAYVTSPSVIADGNYPLTATVQRAGTSNTTASSTSYYKVYSSDITAPTLYWANPADGQTLTGGSFRFAVSSNDDHAVSKIELYVDNAYVSTTVCGGVSYNCQFGTDWSLSGRQGPHTGTFKSYDFMGNVADLTVNFTVS
jgi:hypothetical protein